jgi:uncharacterized protein (TIRG00374 family)
LKFFKIIIKPFLALLIISAGLYIFFKDVDVHNLVQELKSTNIVSIIGGCFCLIASLYLRSLRWKLILPTMADTYKNLLFSNVTIGFMVNNILPARIGELTRAFILWQKNRYPISISIGSLIVERLLDSIIFLSFFIIPVYFLPQCESLKIYAHIALLMIITVIICALFYILFQNTAVRIGNYLIAKFPEKLNIKVVKICNELVSTLDWIYSIKKFFIVVILSILIGACFSFTIILLANKTGISFGLLEGMFVQSYAAFGAAIPLSPGYIGTLHAVMLQGLNIIGMDGDKARALTILYHGLSYIVINVLGFYFLFKIKLSFKEIFSIRKKMNR